MAVLLMPFYIAADKECLTKIQIIFRCINSAFILLILSEVFIYCTILTNRRLEAPGFYSHKWFRPPPPSSFLLETRLL